VTPAHDVNDKALGEKHQLEIIDIFNDDATLNTNGLHYEGKDRFEVRKAIAKELKEKGYLIKTEDYLNKVGTSERTKAVIEPRLSDQWFLNMKEIAKPALDAVINGEVKLVPEKFINTYRHWMENVRDWNISRQLWWGHQIPAYYYGTGTDDFVVAESPDEALKLAKQKSGNSTLKLENLTRDTDALDTWFSSWLWPISVFNGILEPDNEEINYYYPTNDLVTAPEILFFWVARMIIAGYEFRGEKPFNNVYLTGIVRDKQRRKMSKQLGNSPDSIELMKKYGADGVRVGMLMSSPAGNDLMFDEDLCKQGAAFSNKIWNAFRLVKGWEIAEKEVQPEASKLAIAWYKSRFNEALAAIELDFSKYRISNALMRTYKLIWDDFCSWLLEMVKPPYQKPVDAKTYQEVISLFEDNLKILHPFMPFLTEEIWHLIAERTPDEALIIASWPLAKETDTSLLKDFEVASEVISGIRTIRKEKGIAFKEPLTLLALNNEGESKRFNPVILKLGNLLAIEDVTDKPSGALSFRVKSNEYFIPVKSTVNIEEEVAKLKEELAYNEGFLRSVQKKLSNERFVNNAPEKVVAIERKKEADALAKIAMIKESLAGLGNNN
jgi:valyl-tRNA synthetase